MGRSYGKNEREAMKKGKGKFPGADGISNRRRSSEAEEEVLQVYDSVHHEPVIRASTKPPPVTKSVPMEDRETQQGESLPSKPPRYKDFEGQIHVPAVTPIHTALPPTTTPKPQPLNRYKQVREPGINVLPDEMMVIDPAKPLRGEVKFFDRRSEKLFGFIVVDPIDKTPAQLATMTTAELAALHRKEVFFHYNDVAQPYMPNNQLVGGEPPKFPRLMERRETTNFNPPYPTQGDRVVFFPIMMEGPNAEKRSKAVPWAYEKEWDSCR